jgi:hypothetical protein
MTKKTKMILGVLAVAGIGYYLYNKNKTTAPANSMGALKFDGDFDNAIGCSGANGTQSGCPVCHRCLNGQCTPLPPSVCSVVSSNR